MATTKITDLPSLTTPDANTSNTVFVVVDKSSGTFTTKQVTLGVLDTAIDDVAAGAYNHANGAFDQANTNTTTAANAYAHANGAFDAANSASTLAQDAYDYANTIVSDTQVDPYARAHANGAFDLANGTAGIANTDVTNVSISAGDYGSEVIIPVVHLEANGRVSSVTNTNIRSASTSETGVILIEDSVSSTSTANAASPNSVKSSYDHAEAAFTQANTNQSDITTINTTLTEALIHTDEVPTSPLGESGDLENRISIDEANGYGYISIADYDGSTNIWVRFAVTDSW